MNRTSVHHFEMFTLEENGWSIILSPRKEAPQGCKGQCIGGSFSNDKRLLVVSAFMQLSKI